MWLKDKIMPSIASQYEGKTLNQIRDAGIGFRPDILGSFLGIAENAPLSADTIYRANIPQNYQNSSEGNAFRSIFSGNDADILSRQQAAAQEKAQAARMQAIAPAVQSLEASIPEISQKFGSERTRLEAGKDPLKARYQSILDELKRREGVETQETNTALAREFGRRGVPLSSGLYDETGIEKRRPISEFYSGQTKDVGLSQEEGLSNIDQLIASLTGQEVESVRGIRNALASLQSGAGNASIEDAFRTLQAQEQSRQFDEGQTLEKERLRFAQQGQAVEEAMSQRNFAEQVRQYNSTLVENQRQFGIQESRLGRVTPETQTQTKLEFRTEKDSKGNEFVTAYDPYTGRVVSTSKPLQSNTSSATTVLQQQFGQAAKNVWGWLNPFD